MALKRVVVRGPSMLPVLSDGQKLLVHMGAYRRRAPRRGEVVLVQHPEHTFKIVKRVVAVPGETYAGRRLAEDEYVVRGDNRGASTDGRRFGPLPRDALLGRVLFSYRPLRRVR